MVYINDASGTITIPKHTDTTGTYTMILTSNLSDDVVLVENGGDISTNSLYYKFALNNLSGLNVGEYTYKLLDGSEIVVEEGLLMFGTFKRQVIVNNRSLILFISTICPSFVLKTMLSSFSSKNNMFSFP